MSEREREHWDQRYADGGYVPRSEPSAYVERWLEHVPVGRALDLATGTGRNALALARRGFAVTAVDVSAVAIERARERAEAERLEIDWRVLDLDGLDLRGLGGPWDLVTVVRYREPTLWARIVAALSPNGWVLVEHHLRTSRDVMGPRSEEFCIAPGELAEAFRALRIVHLEEVIEGSDWPAAPEATFATARVAACAGDAGY